MLAIAILRTLVVTLGLLVFSPWQVTEVDSTARAQVTTTTCMAAACGPADEPGARVVRAGSRDLALLVVSADDTSPDDVCAPTRSLDGRQVGDREISRGEPRPVRVAWTRPDGPERPPKAGSHILI